MVCMANMEPGWPQNKALCQWIALGLIVCCLLEISMEHLKEPYILLEVMLASKVERMQDFKVLYKESHRMRGHSHAWQMYLEVEILFKQ